ncbi:MAG TPA: hypothetical protein VH083_01470 [Myxococcales bacterium]|nr:hypothetical protein [Myxococcales bacterium]
MIPADSSTPRWRVVVGQLCWKRAARKPDGSSPPRWLSMSTMLRRASWASASKTAWILACEIFIDT